ncbi:MAG: molecular chaperone HtpG, partial [Oscillospiraceae bacterium]|nr:molecular chaperone HtpG [Oscillospiraceae bacterium]
LDFVKETLGERVAKVKLSDRLASRPCALTTEGPVSLEMERYFQHSPSEEMRQVRATRVLEINPAHNAFTKLREAYDGDRDHAAALAKILCVLAEMNAGVDVEDTAGFTELVSALF